MNNHHLPLIRCCGCVLIICTVQEMEAIDVEQINFVEPDLGTRQTATYTVKQLGRENEVPMVSMDGEAHPNMTLTAIGLGLFVALIILLTLIAFITRRERRSNLKHATVCPVRGTSSPIATISHKLAVNSLASRCTLSIISEFELTDTATRL